MFAQLVGCIAVWIAFGDSNRIWTDIFLGFLVVWAYDALSCMWLGATPAMRMVGLRLVELDTAGRPSATACSRRGAMSGVLTVLPIVGWSLWAVSAFGDALGRGFPDRTGHTMVVPKEYRSPIATRDLPGFADGVRPPRVTPWGRVGDLDVRYRARLRRLTDSRLLAGAIGMLALAVSLPYATSSVILLSSLAWVVVFVAHETWLVHRTGVTPGHTIAGLVIVSRQGGGPPGTVRSFLRALVLGLTVYVPLLWPILAVSLVMMRTGDAGRGLHDYAGGTVVVADPTLDPEMQRQRAMRMRMGRAG